ncbi:MAG: hypothetical protein QOH12_3118 [Solirubrobacteraceae bacterium]|jgi:hypothetical protein|nr:hypothetical protein [Solirubrobacteraceae bacterium]
MAIRMARARKAQIDVLAIDGRFKNVLVVSWSTGAAAMTRFVLGLEALDPQPDGIDELLAGLHSARGLDAGLAIATWWHLYGSLQAIWPERFLEAVALARRVNPSRGPVEDRIQNLEAPPSVTDAYGFLYEAVTETEAEQAVTVAEQAVTVAGRAVTEVESLGDPSPEALAIWEDCLLAARQRAIEGNRGMYMPGAGRVNPPLPGDPKQAGESLAPVALPQPEHLHPGAHHE